MESNTLSIDKLLLNEGQIEGLPKNPRFIRDTQFEKLKNSVEEFPEMLKLRELIVYPFENKYVVIAGNMRLRAGQELGIKEFPCKVLPAETTVERLREITIKDNNSFGEWDFDDLANEWEISELDKWGIENLPMDSNWEQLDRLEGEDREVEKKQLIKISVPNTFSKSEIKEMEALIEEALVKYEGISIL